MMLVVLDTNVLASGLAGLRRPTNTPGEVLRRWFSQSFLLIISEPILMELERTLQKPYFLQQISPQERAQALPTIRRQARLAQITLHVAGVATHPEDDLILATAVSANADYLVTGDKQLQRLGSYQGVTILSPRQFLAVLERRE